MYDARATRVICGDRDKVSHLSGDTRGNKKNLIRNWQRVLGVYNIKYVHLCIHAHIYIYAYLLSIRRYILRLGSDRVFYEPTRRLLFRFNRVHVQTSQSLIPFGDAVTLNEFFKRHGFQASPEK